MNRKFSRNDLIYIILFSVFLFGAIVYNYNEKEDRVLIKNNYSITKGRFVDYDKVGDTSTPYITYSYEVEGKLYKRQVYGDRKYEYCYRNDCSNLLFWVIYSPANPEKSLIDLTTEIQGLENPPFPETLENFE